VKITQHINVVALGSFPKALRRSCFWACKQTGFIPYKMVMVNSNNAIMLAHKNHRFPELYVRVEGKSSNVATRTKWSLYPELMQLNWRSKVRTSIKRMLADPELHKRSYSYAVECMKY